MTNLVNQFNRQNPQALLPELAERMLLHHPDGTLVFDETLTVIFVNPAWEQMFTAAQVPHPGKPVAEVLTFLQPEQLIPALEGVRKGEKAHWRQYSDRVNSGGWLDIHIFPYAAAATSAVGGIVSVRSSDSEQQLMESQHFAMQLTETSPDVLVVFDLTRNSVTYMNQAVTQVLGYTPEEMYARLSDSTFSLLHPDDQEATALFLREFSSGRDKEVRELEYRLKDIGGNWRWIRSRNTVFRRDEQGNPTQILGQLRDITDHKVTERLLSGVLDSSLAGVVTLEAVRDAEGALVDFRYRLINKAAQKIFGRSSESLLGRCFLEEYPGARYELFPFYREVVETGTPAQREFFYQSEGFHHWFRIETVRFEDGVVASFTDITEQKGSVEQIRRSEFLLRESQEIGRVGSYEIEVDSGAIYWSPQMYTLFDMPVGQPIGLAGMDACIHPEDLPGLRAARNTLLENGEIDLEYRIVAGLRFPLFVWDRGRLIRDAHGKPLRIVGTIQDITERKTAELEVHQKNEALLQAYRELEATQQQLTQINAQLEKRVEERTRDLAHREKELRYTLAQTVELSRKIAENENFLSSIIDQSPLSTWIADAQGTLIRVNEACLKLFGAQEASQGIGKYNLFQDELLQQQPFFEEIRAVFTRGQIAHFSLDYNVSKVSHVDIPTGVPLTLEVTIFPVRDGQGNVTHAVVQHLDITRRRLVESALERKVKKEQLVRRIAEIASNTFDLYEFADFVTREIGNFLRVDRCILAHYLHDPADEVFNRIEMLGQYCSGEDVKPVRAEDIHSRFPRANRGETSKNFELCVEAGSEEAIPEAIKMYADRYEIRAILVYELYYRKKYFGRFALHQSRPREWTDEEKDFMEEVVTLLGSAVYQLTLYQEVQQAYGVAELQRNRLHDLFMHAPAMICTLRGPEHTFELVNPMFQQLFNARPLVGKPVLEALPEVKGQGLIRVLDQVYDTGERYVGNEVLVSFDRKSNGLLEAGYFNFIYQPMRSMSGEVEGILVLAYEVSDQVLARRVEEENAERFRQLLESLPQMAWTALPDGYLNYCNQRWAEYLPVPAGSISTVFDTNTWKAALHPDDLESTMQQWEHSVQTGETYVHESRFLHRSDQTYRWHLIRAVPIRSEKGDVALWVGTCTDTHNLRMALENLEEVRREFQVLSDFIPQLVWRTRPDGAHDYFNRRWYEYTGLSYEESKNGGWSLVLHPDDQEATFRAWNESLRTGKAYEVEYRFRRRDGTYRWFLGRALPVRNESGEIINWFGTCTDIHDQKIVLEEIANAQQQITRANEELSLANQQLRRINEDLDNFVYTASHDLKAPIANLEGLVNIMGKKLAGRLDEKERTMIDMMQASVGKLNRTILDLTEITKVQKALSDGAETLALADILADVESDLSALLQEAGGRLTVRLDVPEVRFVRKNLRSILYNLISNAIKYRAPGSRAEVEIKTEAVTREGRPYVRLAVRDQGLGIAAHQIPKLFGMFKRLHTHVEGTGIGLYIVKRIVENSGGTIEVESELGKGTTFNVYLPAFNLL